MEFKGTKGNWELINGDTGLIIEPEVGTISIAHVYNFGANDKEALSNAKLIAKAPELLSALEEAINGLEWRKNDDPDLFDKADDYKLAEWKKLISKICG